MRLANGWTLRDFQEQGVKHLAPQRSRLLGDDMGLGKTLEALVLDRLNRMQHKSYANKKTLIVTKKGIIADDTWQRHLRMVAPDDKVYVYNHLKQPAAARKEFIAALKEDYDYYIIHWEGVRLTPDIAKVRWFHIIGDEVHKIKNRQSAVRKEFIKVKSLYKTGATGTPAADKPHDLWAIINWLWPQYYRGYHNFVRHHTIYEDKINMSTGASYREFTGVQNAHELQEQMKPWFVRRLKKDVAKELPDKYYTPVWVDLLPVQRKAYDDMAKHMMTWLENEGEEFYMSTAAVIGRLMRLQQFALGYMKPNPQYAEWSLKYGIQYETWKIYTKDLARQKIPKSKWPKCPVPQPPPSFLMTEPSAKLDWVMEYLEDDNQPIGFFSQFTSPLKLLSKRLETAGISHGLFTGDKSFAEKKQVIQDFQGGKTRIFLGTIKAGGEGIELTRTSRLGFLDRTWEPGPNDQAEDRAYRIGQKNAVEIFDIMARDTVDLGRKAQVLEKRIWIQTMLGDPIRLQLGDQELLDWRKRQRRAS